MDRRKMRFQVGKEWHIQTSVGEHHFVVKNGHADA